MQRIVNIFPRSRDWVYRLLSAVGHCPKSGGVSVVWTDFRTARIKFHVKLPYPRKGPPPDRATLRAHIRGAFPDPVKYLDFAYRKRWIACWFTIDCSAWTGGGNKQ